MVCPEELEAIARVCCGYCLECLDRNCRTWRVKGRPMPTMPGMAAHDGRPLTRQAVRDQQNQP